MKKTFQPVKFHIFFEQSFFSHELTPIKDIQTPLTPLPQELVRFLWKMWNLLNRMKNEIHFFGDFYFSSYGSSKIDHILSTKIAITRKIKIGKLVFDSFQHIPKKKNLIFFLLKKNDKKNCFFGVGLVPPPKNIQGLRIFL